MTNNDFLAQFRLAYPELSTAPDERVIFFYELAQNSMSASVWAAQYKEGILSLTAHMMTMKYGLNGNGAPINTVQQETTSKAIGNYQKAWAARTVVFISTLGIML